MTIAMFGTFGILFVTIKHSIALINAMKALVHRQSFQSSFKVLTFFHCDIIERIKMLNNLMNSMVLVFEIATYSTILFAWIIIFFQRDMIPVALSGAGIASLYFLLCWMDEALMTAFEEISFYLYGLEWYMWSPKQRRTLLQVKILMDRPKILKAGPFHAINYTNLGTMVHRVYSYGIVINKIIGRK